MAWVTASEGDCGSGRAEGSTPRGSEPGPFPHGGTGRARIASNRLLTSPTWISGRSRGSRHEHPDFTQELPRKLLPTRTKEAQGDAVRSSNLIYEALFVARWLWCQI